MVDLFDLPVKWLKMGDKLLFHERLRATYGPQVLTFLLNMLQEDFSPCQEIIKPTTNRF